MDNWQQLLISLWIILAGCSLWVRYYIISSPVWLAFIRTSKILIWFFSYWAFRHSSMEPENEKKWGGEFSQPEGRRPYAPLLTNWITVQSVHSFKVARYNKCVEFLSPHFGNHFAVLKCMQYKWSVQVLTNTYQQLINYNLTVKANTLCSVRTLLKH